MRLPFAESVRARITFLAAILVAAVLGITSVIVVVTQERMVLDGVDENLRQRADDLETLIESVPADDDLALPAAPDTVAQLVDADGIVVTASHAVVFENPLGPIPDADEMIISVHNLPIDDDEFRLLSRRLEGGSVLYLADSIDDLRDSLRTLTTAFSIAIPLVTLILAAIVWFLIGRTLRPVEAIRAEVAEMAGEEFHRRVPVPRAADEVGRLARTMNEMLQRVEESQVRQRRFAADASHELRSPLARIRTELEVDLAHPDGVDHIETHRSVLEEADTLQRMIDDLLVLARGEQGLAATATMVDLDDIVLRESEQLRSRDDITLDISRISAAQVHGDEIQLGRAVRNLVDNAARHAQGEVRLTLSESDGCAELTIADDGPGIPVGSQEQVFERFTRLDAARSRHDGGSGLGLPISREIIERHGGSLVIDQDFANGARFVLTLPLSTS